VNDRQSYGQGAPAPAPVPSGYLLAAVALLLLAPVALVAWMIGTAALRYGARRWVLALCGLVPGIVALVVLGPNIAAAASLAGARAFGAAGTSALPALGPVVGWFGRWAWTTAPLGVPAGMVAAAVPPRRPALPAPEWEAREQRARAREDARARKRAVKRAEREGADPRSNALAVSLGGMVASWRIGDLVVPPEGQLGLAWLLIGAPGAGKTTAIQRLAYLAGLERRHLVVIDAKGGHDGLAQDVVAAYLAGWAASGGGDTPTIRLFPNERLSIWHGDPQAIVNRLVEVWDWTAESSWFREPVMTALRLALGQPGPACQSSAELVRRLDPGALTRAWEHDPEMLNLVRSLTQGKRNHLADVHIRVGNLVAALAGALDGEHAWEDADCWVVTVPAMVASRDADSALRVLMSDYAHFTMASDRKGRRPSTLIVDEFSAIAGGRRVAIDLLERGRGAGAGVILAGQSAVALGNEEERARLLAAASAIILFRTPQPAELAALAGTERVGEGAWSYQDMEGADRPDRVTVTTRSRARVDQDQVRQLPTGEADLIVRGVAERMRIIQTAVPREVAAGISELCAPAPVRPVDRREVPPPPLPSQGQAATPSPSASLDTSGRSSVRRYRPPPAGEGQGPPTDRDNRGEP
jgi:hypothetical protein